MIEEIEMYRLLHSLGSHNRYGSDYHSGFYVALLS